MSKIYYKTEEEIDLIRESSLLVGKTLAEVAKNIKPGVTTLELDKIAEEYIRDNNAIPGFLGMYDFPNTLCASLNSAVVHGIPNNIPLKDGDIISLDCGVLKNGFYGDVDGKTISNRTRWVNYRSIVKCNVSSRVRKRTCCNCSYFRKDAYALYQIVTW
jgi:methionine aminopeptidase